MYRKCILLMSVFLTLIGCTDTQTLAKAAIDGSTDFETMLITDNATDSDLPTSISHDSVEGSDGRVQTDTGLQIEPPNPSSKDNTLWELQASGTDEPLTSVWGSSTRSVFAVGEGGVILHFDGNTWSSMSYDANDGHPLRQVFGVSATDVYVVGGSNGVGFVLHYDGNVWEETLRVNANDGLWAVWGFSISDIYVLGHEETIDETDVQLGYHYDGSDWAELSCDGCPQEGNAIWGSYWDDIYVAGHAGISHFNGQSWQMAHAVVDAKWGDIWGRGPTDVYFGHGTGLIHFDGTLWTQIPLDKLFYSGVPWDVTVRVRRIVGTLDTDVFFLCRSHLDYDPIQDFMAHFNGKHWTGFPIPHGSVMNDVWVAPDRDIFAVGPEGAIWHYRSPDND